MRYLHTGGLVADTAATANTVNLCNILIVAQRGLQYRAIFSQKIKRKARSRKCSRIRWKSREMVGDNLSRLCGVANNDRLYMDASFSFSDFNLESGVYALYASSPFFSYFTLPSLFPFVLRNDFVVSIIYSISAVMTFSIFVAF